MLEVDRYCTNILHMWKLVIHMLQLSKQKLRMNLYNPASYHHIINVILNLQLAKATVHQTVND